MIISIHSAILSFDDKRLYIPTKYFYIRGEHMTVRKREGEIVDFDIKKIERVISLAAKRAKEFIPEDLHP